MKAQSAIEFTLLMSFLFLIFSVFVAAVNSNILNIHADKQRRTLEEMGRVIEAELKLASTLEDGYIRHLEIPEELDGKKFELEIETLGAPSPAHLIGRYNDEPNNELVIRLPSTIKLGSGSSGCNLQPGFNCISKENGIVYINHFTGNRQRLCLDVKAEVHCP